MLFQAPASEAMWTSIYCVIRLLLRPSTPRNYLRSGLTTQERKNALELSDGFSALYGSRLGKKKKSKIIEKIKGVLKVQIHVIESRGGV